MPGECSTATNRTADNKSLTPTVINHSVEEDKTITDTVQTSPASSAAARIMDSASAVDTTCVKSQRIEFLVQCSRRNILLEGLVALTVIDQPEEAAQVYRYRADVARVQFFHPSGDIHSIIDVVRSWCNSLQAEQLRGVHRSGMQYKQTWCYKNGLCERALKQVEERVKQLHETSISECRELAGVALKFNKDVETSAKNLTEFLCVTFHSRLCIYRGEHDLGYHMIATKQRVHVMYTAHPSFVTLMNAPPTFALVFSSPATSQSRRTAVTGLREEIESTCLVKVDDLAASQILESQFQLSARQLKREQIFHKFSTHNVGLKCGEDIERSGIGGDFHRKVVLLYDSDRRAVDYYCTWAEKDTVLSALVERVKEFKQRQASTTGDFPFPHRYSPLRVHVKSGFKSECLLSADEFARVNTRVAIANSIKTSSLDKTCPASLCDEVDEMITETDRFDSQELAQEFIKEKLASPNRNRNVKFVPSVRHDMEDEHVPVQFVSHVVVKATWKETSVTPTDIDRLRVQSILERVLFSNGMQVHAVRTGAVRVETLLNPSAHIDVAITFATIISARHGIDALDVFSQNSAPHFVITCRRKLEESLRTVIFDVSTRAFAPIHKIIKEKLDTAQNREKFVRKDENGPTRPGVQRFSYIASDIRHFAYMNDVIRSALQPAVVKLGCRKTGRKQWRYLQSHDGQLFRQVLEGLTGAYVHLPAYLQEAHIYGTPACVASATKQLVDQCTAWSTADQPTEISRWNLIDMNDQKFCPDALARWYKEFREEVKQADDGSSNWYIDAENLHLWIRTTSQVAFDEYRKTVGAKLEIPPKPKKCEVIKTEPPKQKPPRTKLTKRQRKRKWWKFEDNCLAFLEVPYLVQKEDQEEDQSEPCEDIPSDEEYEFEPEKDANLTCSCCYKLFERSTDPERYVSEACGCVHCMTCIETMVGGAAKEKRFPLVLACCNTPLTITDIQYICGITRAANIETAIRSTVHDFVMNNQTYTFCARTDCPGVCKISGSTTPGDKVQMNCLFCSTKLCLECKGRYHGNSRCGENSGLEYWMKENKDSRKCCPNCRMGIEKVDGCQNVFCVSCKKYTCWTCSKYFSDVAQNVYDHCTEKHGGYY